MNDKVENLILTPVQVMREENAQPRAGTRDQIADLRPTIGGQGVFLTSIAGHIHRIGGRVEALETTTDA